MLLQTLLQAHSGLFHLYFEKRGTSHFADFEDNHFTTIYLVWPISAILINGATKFYASRIKQKMMDSVRVFTIMSHPQSDIEDNKFSFSINSVLGIPLMIMFAVFSSIASRKIRLLFFYPFQMMLMSVVLPSIVILKNCKMRQQANQFLREKVFEKVSANFLLNSSKVFPIKS